MFLKKRNVDSHFVDKKKKKSRVKQPFQVRNIGIEFMVDLNSNETCYVHGWWLVVPECRKNQQTNEEDGCAMVGAISIFNWEKFAFLWL